MVGVNEDEAGALLDRSHYGVGIRTPRGDISRRDPAFNPARFKRNQQRLGDSFVFL
jgi:hypothetical protein